MNLYNSTYVNVRFLPVLTLAILTAATNGSDYIGVSIDLVFTAGTSDGAAQCVDIIILDSPTVEEDETFTVTLTTASSITTSNNVTTVMIRNIDSKLGSSKLITCLTDFPALYFEK